MLNGSMPCRDIDGCDAYSGMCSRAGTLLRICTKRFGRTKDCLPLTCFLPQNFPADSSERNGVPHRFMAIQAGSTTAYTSSAPATNRSAMAMVTTLFFMWGFVTSLNDVLIPHLKDIFGLSYAGAMLVQVFFFFGYFVFALPAGKLVEVIGYKKTMVTGLIVMAVGALIFIPAASVPSYP